MTLQYCKDNLKTKEKAEEYKKEDEIKQALHIVRMKDKDSDGFEVQKEDFDDVVEKFKSKQTKAYDFLTKADKDYKHAIFLLCKKFIDTEEFPDRFRETLLIMIWKKKGPAEVLKNNRFVHMKHYLARTCEALTFNSSKNQIFQKSTVYQIGGQSGHSPEEHVFTLKSVIGLMKNRGEGLILNLVDIVSFFDREDILDVVEALEDMEVNKKVIRLLYKLNEGTEIKVKTSVGETKSAQDATVKLELGQQEDAIMDPDNFHNHLELLSEERLVEKLALNIKIIEVVVEAYGQLIIQSVVLLRLKSLIQTDFFKYFGISFEYVIIISMVASVFSIFATFWSYHTRSKQCFRQPFSLSTLLQLVTWILLIATKLFVYVIAFINFPALFFVPVLLQFLVTATILSFTNVSPSFRASPWHDRVIHCMVDTTLNHLTLNWWHIFLFYSS